MHRSLHINKIKKKDHLGFLVKNNTYSCILIMVVNEWVYIFVKSLLNYTRSIHLKFYTYIIILVYYIYYYYINYNPKLSSYKLGKICTSYITDEGLISLRCKEFCESIKNEQTSRKIKPWTDKFRKGKYTWQINVENDVTLLIIGEMKFLLIHEVIIPTCLSPIILNLDYFLRIKILEVKWLNQGYEHFWGDSHKVRKCVTTKVIFIYIFTCIIWAAFFFTAHNILIIYFTKY